MVRDDTILKSIPKAHELLLILSLVIVYDTGAVPGSCANVVKLQRFQMGTANNMKEHFT
jgi:hypothetical protein